MTFIFDEKAYAEKLLEKGFVKFMSKKDLFILAKYLMHLGKNARQVRLDLEEFCLRYNPAFNKIISSEKLDSAIKLARKSSLRLRSNVEVTKKEFDIIKAQENYKHEKILFVMLVVSKYFGKDKSEDDTFYVNENFSGILRLAKVHAQKQDRHQMLYELNSTGLITATMINSFSVNFVDLKGEPFIVVDDMENIVGFYPIYCEVCKKNLIERKGKNNNHRMCEDCWEDKNREIQRNQMREKRNV